MVWGLEFGFREIAKREGCRFSDLWLRFIRVRDLGFGIESLGFSDLGIIRV